MQQLILPGIDFAPSQVLRYGLREFHHYPLASYGKNAAGIWLGSRRMPPAEAWTHPELELGRTANSIPALLFDIDRPDWGLEIFDGVVPVPNWATWRRANQHAHLVYALARPVLRGEQARPTPQGWLARIGEYIAATLQADLAYPAVLAHNPLEWASHGRYRTDWLREAPYTLAELGEAIPFGWRRPRRPLTVYGRNDALFRAGMKWTGRPRHWGDWPGLATYLAAMNAEFVLPLGERELGGIVKSIRRIQTKNLQERADAADVLVHPGGAGSEIRPGAADEERGSRRGYRSGRAVRESKKAVARAYNLNPYAVRHILKRDGMRQGGNEPKQDVCLSRLLKSD